MGELAALVRAQRLNLADFLEGLAPDDWAVPSLCAGWTVRDVAAHLAWAPAQRPPQLLRLLVRSGFRVNRLSADAARRWAERGRDAILAQLRANAASGARPPGTPEVAALADAVVHALDIRRPLGRTTPLDPAAFPIVADLFTTMRWPLTITIGGHARTAIRGLRLVTSDLPWSHGEGPEVRASAESLLLVLTGRPVADGELSGPGASTLLARLR
ncbi:maleylpyruvate isomerase family mycothiol-dependent enzyme [Prauserella flavalba]|uniref:Mycothiol-dependent maleylpyruvate isomerase metal-binding domain-containing protein n=1 Tax=Prauserella flavalba TaxID=1477506 RepID=A0A318LTS8_9PSEU|nr:maleylpyruvate isomerase family mycothiol-dependent enzyme [Prauserella flavalba]PXY35748.1 hypothetical protein BA062_09670 [Prauserella flavalba]